MPLVFGYGSLVNRQLRGPYLQEWPARLVTYLRRTWNAHCVSREGVKYTALGLQACYERSPVNGVVFEVTPERYEQLLEREKGYRIHTATLDMFEWSNQEKPTEGPISVFVTEEPKPPSHEYPLHPRYLQNCVEGFQALGPGALEEFYESLLA
jgi:cation transport regulator ChaC